MKLTVEFPSVAYREGPGAVARRARAIEQIGYDHIVNATAIFQAGARSVDAMLDALGVLHAKIRGAVG
jgi:hypothetical protein